PHSMSVMMTAKSPAHFRFWIFDFRWSDKESINRIQDRAIMYFSLNRKSAIEKLKLLNDPIRLREHLRRNRQADLLGRLEIDDDLELRRLLDRNIAKLGTFRNLLHVRGGAPAQVGHVHAVRHKAPGVYEIALAGHHRERLR